MKRFNNIFMFFMFICFIILGSYTLIRDQKDISEMENRALSKFDHFTLTKYMNGSFQNNLEDAFLDQFVGSQTIRKIMKSQIIMKESESLFCKDSYINIGDDLYKYDCDDYIINRFDLKNRDNSFLEMSKIYNELNNSVDTYYYYITTSANYDFVKNKMGVDVPALINKYWKGKYSFDYLEIDSFDTFKNYFYKTDHHWNYVGAYQGYKDIMNMIDSTINILKPIDEVSFGANFYGTRSKFLSDYDIKEMFKVYQYDLPNYKFYINGDLAEYGEEKRYFSGQYGTDITENHYHKFYGWDKGEIVIDSPNNKNDNILILGNSYTHPINKLIASHFNKTHIIDIRHYEEDMGRKFDIENYINENKIDKVLVVMDIWSIGDVFSKIEI